MLGVNSRLDTLQAAILLAKIEILDNEIKRRRKIAEDYTRGFSEHQAIGTPEVLSLNRSAWAQYTITIEERERLQKMLLTASIPSAVHYPKPLSHQRSVADPSVILPVSDAYSKKVISLPCHAYMSDELVEKVKATMARF